MPFKDEFIAELRFVAKCQGNTKTVRHRKSSSADSNQSDGSKDQSVRTIGWKVKNMSNDTNDDGNSIQLSHTEHSKN